MNPNKKRIIIGAIYILIFAFVGLIFYIFSRPEPNCFDLIQNQNEEGVDCGGICQKRCEIAGIKNIEILETGFVDSGAENKYDAYAVIFNPNLSHGGNEFVYEFKLRDGEGNESAMHRDKSFILPGERKYLVIGNIEMKTRPIVAEVDVQDAQWIEANELYEKPDLKVVRKNYNEISGGIGFAEVTGLVRNESPFDFSAIRIKVILKDDSGKVVALNSTEMRTVRSGESREFKVFWPNKFYGSVSNMEIQTDVNIFDSESFAKKFFRPEKFQQY